MHKFGFSSFEDDSDERVIYVYNNNDLWNSREKTDINENLYWRSSNGTHTMIVRKNNQHRGHGPAVATRNNSTVGSAPVVNTNLGNVTDLINGTDILRGNGTDIIDSTDNEGSGNETVSSAANNGTVELLPRLLQEATEGPVVAEARIGDQNKNEAQQLRRRFNRFRMALGVDD